MVQVAAYSVAQRRREWSYFEKRAILKAAFAPGACVAEGARRAEVRMSLIYRWRKTLAAIGNAGAQTLFGTGFACMVITPEPPMPPLADST